MISGFHFLLTYRCTRECPHCFVWGSPDAPAVFQRDQLVDYLEEADRAGIPEVAFEGGEPFIFYDLLLVGVREAVRRGKSVSIVTNGFWATSEGRARQLVGELASEGVESVMISTDDYHGGEEEQSRAQLAHKACQDLGLASFMAETRIESVLFRGRAAHKLAGAVADSDWGQYTSCESEDLANPGRVHVDPHGNVMVCQGICIGNAERRPLRQILTEYDPADNPIVSELLTRGPQGLAAMAGKAFSQAIGQPGTDGKCGFADACHLCYEARRALRDRFPEILAPAHVYGQRCGSAGRL